MEGSTIFASIVQNKEWLNVSRPLTVDDLKGRIVLLDFWTFCCINCIHVISELTELEKRFGDDLMVVGVHSGKFIHEKTVDGIRQAIIRHDIEHPVVNDSDYAIWKSFGVRAWPTLVLINPEGRIEQTYSGEGNKDAIARDVARLIKQHKGSLVSAPQPRALEKEKKAPTVLYFPTKILSVDFQGRPALFVADTRHHRIVAMWKDGTIFETIGTAEPGDTDGSFDDSRFNMPQGMAFAHNMLYVADTGNHKLRLVNFETKNVSTVAGTGKRGPILLRENEPAATTALASPWDLAWYPDAHTLAIAMAGTHQLWTCSPKNETVSVLAGNGRESIDDGPFPRNSLSQPSGLSVFEGKLYFVDSETSSLRVLENGKVTTLIGTGLFDFGFSPGRRGIAMMQHSLGLFADERGVFIADTYNHSIRRYDYATKMLETVCGDGKPGTQLGAADETRLHEPNDIEWFEGLFYIADTNNHRIVVFDPVQKITRELSISEKEMKEAPGLRSENELPNLQKLSELTFAAGTQVSISFGLPDGWKMNDLAPSWMVLFEIDDEQARLVKEFEKTEIEKQNITLPGLAPGKEYRLQGTLFYCEKKENPLCLLKSYDVVVRTQEGGQDSVMLRLHE